MMKKSISLGILLLAPVAWADTPSQILETYRQAAAKSRPGFTADAARGRNFATHPWGHSDQLASCISCHTDNLRQSGKHAITGKTIAPMSPSANPERFSDPAKVEKWFGRNCKEVVGRVCTPDEKTDFMAFAIGGN